jgi:hypothetical protein
MNELVLIAARPTLPAIIAAAGERAYKRPDMIKPGSKDEKVSLLIAGEELTELKRITWLMSESFGLDTRIENYQGKRPFWLARWLTGHGIGAHVIHSSSARSRASTNGPRRIGSTPPC